MILGTMFSETIAPYLFGGTRYTVEEYYYLPTYRVQIAKGSYQNTGYMKERKMINGVWGEWVDYSTTTKTDILLKNNWVLHQGSLTITRVGNICNFSCVIKDGIIAPYTVIAELPTGFIPQKTRYALGIKLSNNTPITIVIDIDGKIKAHSNSTLETNYTMLNCTYEIEG